MRSEVPPRPDHGWPYGRWAGDGQSVFRCRSGDRFCRTCGSVETVCRDGRPPQNRTRRNRAARRDRHRIGDRTGRTERRPHRHRGQHGGTYSRRRRRGSSWSDDRARGDPATPCRQPKGARARNGKLTGVLMTVDLMAFARAVANGDIRVIDLTQTLSQEFPTIVLPPELGQCAPFRMEEVSRYDERGPAWYWNNISLGEHTGTHFDAPIHWISGKDLPNNAVDTINVARFIAPAAVIDCSKECAADPDFALTIPFVKQWEARHGRIGQGCWVLLRTDWSKQRRSFLSDLRIRGNRLPGWPASAKSNASKSCRS